MDTRKLQVLQDEQAIKVLDRLHKESDRQNLTLGWRMLPYLYRLLTRRPLPWSKLEAKFSDMYIALDPDNGILCYLLARATNSRNIVEFGTSFGISTIYLALAVRDNGGGQVITTELVAEKAARARENIREAGLEEFVDLREGDAMKT